MCLVSDEEVPFLLHPVGDIAGVCDYVLVGEAYVHGIMYGEAAPVEINH